MVLWEMLEAEERPYPKLSILYLRYIKVTAPKKSRKHKTRRLEYGQSIGCVWRTEFHEKGKWV